jgi:hypothetical protein
MLLCKGEDKCSLFPLTTRFVCRWKRMHCHGNHILLRAGFYADGWQFEVLTAENHQPDSLVIFWFSLVTLVFAPCHRVVFNFKVCHFFRALVEAHRLVSGKNRLDLWGHTWTVARWTPNAIRVCTTYFPVFTQSNIVGKSILTVSASPVGNSLLRSDCEMWINCESPGCPITPISS